MKTVKETCELRPGALDVVVGDQVEDLEALLQDMDGAAFFEKTYVTEGMRKLLKDGMERLAGQPSSAVFELKQAMGGGKTHSQVALGALAKSRELRRAVVPDAKGIDSFDSAAVAAFTGRNYPANFFWGEIARQLGHEDMFAGYWRSGPKAPDKKAWMNLFQTCGGPILIILDELPPYFQYYCTQVSGEGTIATIAAAAFANLLVAAAACPAVCVCVSTLDAAYADSSALLQSVLNNARQELGRVASSITPVNLESQDIFGIIRKRLVAPACRDKDIAEVAAAFERRLKEAAEAGSIPRGSVSMHREIAETYPFHPDIKHVVALFKENSSFKQTRGLLEFLSRLLKSVWTSRGKVYLIGPQHFDFSILQVREKLSEISGMRDVIAKDIWDSAGEATAQKIDDASGGRAASQAASLLLVASLSTAMDAVRGLPEAEAYAMLIDPEHCAAEFSSAIKSLLKTAWYLHRRRDEGGGSRLCFDRQESVNKRLEHYAETMPDNKADECVKERLEALFRPQTKTAYEQVLPLPRLEEAEAALNRRRPLLIAYPHASGSSLESFFNSLSSRNNFLVLTGQHSQIASIRQQAKTYLAIKKVAGEIAVDHPFYSEISEKDSRALYDFSTTILNAYNELVYPRRDGSGRDVLSRKSIVLDAISIADVNSAGCEEKIAATLSGIPLKLYPKLDRGACDAVVAAVEGKIFGAQEVLSQKAIEDGMRQNASMPWVPCGGLRQIIDYACEAGRWERLETLEITRCPRPKTTKVIVVSATSPDAAGTAKVQVETAYAGERPRIHYAEDGEVSESSPVLNGLELATRALRVSFLAVDPDGKYSAGRPTVWENRLVIRQSFDESARTVELCVAPRGRIFYSTDGSEPRNGREYDGPFGIGPERTTVLVFAECDGIEGRQTFEFAAEDDAGGGVQIADGKPVRFSMNKTKALAGRKDLHDAIVMADGMQAVFRGVTLKFNAMAVSLEGVDVEAAHLHEGLRFLESLADHEDSCGMLFRTAQFKTGIDFKKFCGRFGINAGEGEVEQ